MTSGPATIAAVGLLAGTLRMARSPSPPRLDVVAAARVARPRGDAVDRAVGVLTDLGSVYGLLGVSGTLALRGHGSRASEVLAGGTVAWVAAQGAKTVVDRRRPYESAGAERLVAEPAGSSWPSGHTAVAAATAAALVPHLPPGAAAAAIGTTGVVAASRLYVGVHWASDVMAGIGVGVLSTSGAVTLLRRLRR